MKLRSLLSLILVISTVLPATSKCDFWNDKPTGDSHGQQEFCYSITTDREAYGYGDEIEISVVLQLFRSWSSPVEFDFLIEESPNFEIIGERVHVFENIKTDEYYCSDTTGIPGKSFEFKFKIKINEPTYTTESIQIAVICKPQVDVENEYVTEYETMKLTGIAYVSDSQGIMVYQMPVSYNHFGLKDGKCKKDFTTGHKEMIIASYNREYQAGVSVEELIDRYVQDDYKLKNCVYLEKDYRDGRHSFSYVSAGIRFRIYLPEGHEYLSLSDGRYNRESKKEFMEIFLLFALEKGAITEEEYSIEMERISNDAQELRLYGYSNTGFKTGFEEIQDKLIFTVPTGDDYFNRVISV